MIKRRLVHRPSKGMATASPQSAEPHPLQPVPLFRRPTRQDALELAEAVFLNGERVDMQALASQLGVSRVTIFRWVGSREQLLEQVLDGLTSTFVATARAQAEGDGEDRVLDFVRRLMTATARFEPARRFVAREPQLALRLLLAEDGVVHQRLAEGLRHVLTDAGLAANPDQLKSFVDVLVQVGTALEWATLAIGDEPQIERTVEIGRALLQAATRLPARSASPRDGKGTKRTGQ
jgi:AcrR family transcriptional regulator